MIYKCNHVFDIEQGQFIFYRLWLHTLKNWSLLPVSYVIHNFLWLEDFRTLVRFPWIFPGYSVSNVSLCHGSIPTGSAEGVVVHD